MPKVNNQRHKTISLDPVNPATTEIIYSYAVNWNARKMGLIKVQPLGNSQIPKKSAKKHVQKFLADLLFVSSDNCSRVIVCSRGSQMPCTVNDITQSSNFNCGEKLIKTSCFSNK